MAKCPGVIYVSISEGGSVSVNDKIITIEKVAPELNSLRLSGKQIWFHRANAGSEPAAKEWTNIKAVLDAMMATRLPISFGSQADFSDYIDARASATRARCAKHRAEWS